MEQLDPELKYILEHRPNIYGNTLFIALVKFMAWLLCLAAILMGIYLAYIAALSDTPDPKISREEMTEGILFLSVLCFLFALLLMVIVWFGRMLIRRNQFIMALDEWYEKKRPPKK